MWPPSTCYSVKIPPPDPLQFCRATKEPTQHKGKALNVNLACQQIQVFDRFAGSEHFVKSFISMLGYYGTWFDTCICAVFCISVLHPSEDYFTD